MEKKCWNHFVVRPNNKNIDKICKIWHDYGMKMVQAERYGQTDDMKSSYWASARDEIKELIEFEHQF